MLERTAAAALLLLAASCATMPSSHGAFVFAVLGDAPYNDREEAPFEHMLAAMGAEPLAFAVHVGDIKAGSTAPCTDALYAKRRAQFDRFAHPLFYTPGDNEWTDCRRRGAGGYDAIERLARIREVFFADAGSLGARHLAAEQQPGYPENRAWTYSTVRFVTLNYPGKSNNEGYDRASDAEALARSDANRRWLARAVQASADPGTRALVIATQANPWVGKRSAYDPLLRQVAQAAATLGKPVLFVHGDTHMYRVDTPFVDAGGIALAQATRLETYGSPFVGWVRVTVDPERPDVFTFEPKLQAVIPP